MRDHESPFDADRTRRLAYRIADAIYEDRHTLGMVATREAGHAYIDCTDECIAARALDARHKWAWAATGFLRWLLTDERAEAREE